MVPAPADFGSSLYRRAVRAAFFSPALPALGYCTSGGRVGVGGLRQTPRELYGALEGLGNPVPSALGGDVKMGRSLQPMGMGLWYERFTPSSLTGEGKACRARPTKP